MQMSKEVSILKIDEILPNRFQPRIVFDENAINELTESIKEYGVIEPIIVRKVADKFEIIAGERRYKASVLAGKETIPAIVTDLNDKDSAEIALIENVQRQNLTPIEEAVSYKKILDMGYMNQSELAEKLGKTQSTVANKLRLLNLTDTVQESLLQEKISERHARSLLRLPKDKQNDMLEKIIKERMTVRKTDEEINKILTSSENIKEKEENNMNNNEFMNQFNIPNTPIMNGAQVAPATAESPAPAPVAQPAVEPAMPSIPEIQPVVQPEIGTMPSESMTASVMPEMPAIQPVAPIQASETPTVQTIDNEPATAENSDTPITGKFFNMFNTEEEPAGEEKELVPEINPVQPIQSEQVIPAADNNSFNPFGNIATTMSETQSPTPVTQPVVEPTMPIMPEMPAIQPVVQSEVAPAQSMEPIPMPTIPVAPEMQPVAQNEVNPLQTFQLNDNQEFTNSSVVELGTLQNKRMEEPTLQPLMDIPDNTPKIDIKEVINMIRKCAIEIEKNGYTIDTDELDFDDSYQVIFKINKND